ncbi:hypothetical protein Syun_015973 [Stephania yunnanensis]|uniref:Uncharacterized protein n=1 Tax=Stephania yunnanensis TaxID=152371 RepID=A0AAP0J422_9MAGN
MVQKLLHNSSSSTTSEDDHTFTPFTSFSTPLDHSCNISPSDSCRVSRELCPADYFFDCSTTTHHDDVLLTNNNNNNSITSSTCSSGSTKSWSKKLKLIKQSSSIGSKLKASRAYLKSLFGKSSSGCADEGTTSAVSKAKECLNKYTKGAAAAKKKKNPFGQIYRESICRHQIEDCEREKMSEDIGVGGGGHRRSFSGAIIKRCSATNKSPFSTSSSSNSSGSSSFSLSNANSSSSSGFHDLHLLKRSSSDSSEIESSIQGAIAHCKKSQQLFNKGRKTLSSEVGICSLSASMVAACEDQERPPLCRG